ncbi:MAG: hypothetical protein RL591_1903 [Planctomycetota bacterium]
MVAFLSTSIGVFPSPQMIERLLVELRLASAPLGFESRERFPCETCACGCASAHECWSNCCCHTEQERIQWAIEQGVEPPKTVRPSLLARYMRAKLEQAAVVVAQREQIATDELPSCCRERAEQARAAAKSCCSSSDSDCGADSDSCADSGSDSCCSSGSDSSCGSVGVQASAKRGQPLGPCVSPLGCKGVSSALFAFAFPPAFPSAELDCRWLAVGVWVGRSEPVFDYATRILDAESPPPRNVTA